MNITKISMRKCFYGMMKAVVSITINNDITVCGIKILEKEKGRLYIAMPSRQDNSGKYHDVVRPASSEARKSMESLIFLEYYKQLEKTRRSLNARAINEGSTVDFER